MAKKIAIVTDSNSGITQAQAKELGLHVLPMPFMINNETYYEDITLTQDQFYERLAQGADVITSQPSPDAVMKLWDELLMEYDEIVHIPMSSGLSGSCQSAMMLAEDYDGKMHCSWPVAEWMLLKSRSFLRTINSIPVSILCWTLYII